AVVYIILNFILTSFASWLEARLRRSKRSTGAVLGAEDMEELNPAAVGGSFGTGGEGGGPGGFGGFTHPPKNK
ncbi:amino acid ABC transporter permease, partial [Streptomyces sp. NPDC126514]